MFEKYGLIALLGITFSILTSLAGYNHGINIGKARCEAEKIPWYQSALESISKDIHEYNSKQEKMLEDAKKASEVVQEKDENIQVITREVIKYVVKNPSSPECVIDDKLLNDLNQAAAQTREN